MTYWIALHVLDYFIYLLIYREIFHAKLQESAIWIAGLLFGSCAGMVVLNEIGIFSYGGKAIAFTCVIALLILAKQGRLRTLLLFPIAFLLSGSIHVLFSYLFSFLLGVSYREYHDVKVYTLLTEVPLLLILLFIWFENRKKEEQPMIQFSVPKYLIIFLGSCCVFFLVAVSQGFMLGEADIDMLVKPMAICMTVGGIVFVGLGLWQIILEMRAREYQLENEHYRNYLDKQETHIRDIIDSDQRIRSFRHDIRAHLIALEAGVDKGDLDFLKQYLIRMKEENELSSIVVYTGVAAVDAIIAEWHEKAIKNQVEWNWDGSLLTGTNIEPFDLCVIFSNLLSNAVEAVLLVEDGKEKRIDVYSAIFQGNLIIRISNTCKMDARTADVVKTTKADRANHGFGTKNVLDIVKKRQGTMESKVSNGLYEVEIMA